MMDDSSDRNSPDGKPRWIAWIPGMREQAPRRNVLVALVYLFFALLMVGFLDWLIGFLF